MAYVHPDGTPLDRLMAYLQANGGRAVRRQILHQCMAEGTLAKAQKQAQEMGLITTRMHAGALLLEVTKQIAQPTPHQHRAKLIKDARDALALAMVKLADLEDLHRRGKT
jgi:hypothetical protein